MELVKLPVPLPLVVWLPLTVGLGEVLQQTPRAVTAEPLSAVTLPPQLAVVCATLVTLLVVTVGAVILASPTFVMLSVNPEKIVSIPQPEGALKRMVIELCVDEIGAEITSWSES